MKLATLVATIAITPLVACTSVEKVIDEQATIQPNEARIDFYVQRLDRQREFVQLMCENNRPNDEIEILDVEAGEHILYVRSRVINSNLLFKNVREAVVRLDVNLEGGKRYTLNQDREDDNVTLWLQEADTGLIVSETVSTTMGLTGAIGNLRMKQCQEGTV